MRIAVCAWAVKYDWLAPRMLELARTGKQHWLYGDTDEASIRHRYRESAQALLFLTAWAEIALSL